MSLSEDCFGMKGNLSSILRASQVRTIEGTMSDLGSLSAALTSRRAIYDLVENAKDVQIAMGIPPD
jgi:hypothetical protein